MHHFPQSSYSKRTAGSSSRKQPQEELLKYLKHIPDEEIVGLNLPTAVPYVFEFDNDLNLKKDYFLGDPEKIKKLMEAVADQGKTQPRWQEIIFLRCPKPPSQNGEYIKIVFSIMHSSAIIRLYTRKKTLWIKNY